MASRWILLLRLALHFAEGLLKALTLFALAGGTGRERLARDWSRRLLGILGVRLVVKGDVPGPDSGNLLLVSNHVSWVDVFALLAVRYVRFVSKAEVRSWPLMGWLAERAGTLFLERGKRADAARVNRHIGDVLAAGGRVAFFPEGTTSNGLELKHFHASLLEPAVLADSRVQPVALRYRRGDGTPCLAPAYITETTLMDTLRAMAEEKEIVVELVFLPPLSAAGHNRRELARLAETAIRGALGFAGAGSPPGTPGDPPAA